MFGNLLCLVCWLIRLPRPIASFAGGLCTEESDRPLSTIFFWRNVEFIMMIRMMMYVVMSTTLSNNTV